MSVEGLCGVCESRPAIDVCDQCGTPVCEVHSDRGTGLCQDCARSSGRPSDRSVSDEDVLR